MEVRVDWGWLGGLGLAPPCWGNKPIVLAVKKWPRKNRYCMVLCFLFWLTVVEKKKHPCHMSNSYPFLFWRNLYLVSISQMHRWVFCRRQDTPSRLKVLVGSPSNNLNRMPPGDQFIASKVRMDNDASEKVISLGWDWCHGTMHESWGHHGWNGYRCYRLKSLTTAMNGSRVGFY